MERLEAAKTVNCMDGNMRMKVIVRMPRKQSSNSSTATESIYKPKQIDWRLGFSFLWF